MSNLTIKKLLALPQTFEPSTLYLIKSIDANLTEIYVSTADGSAVRHVLNQADVQAMIDSHVASGADKLSVARDITITGDATYTVTFDGSQDVSAVLTLADTGIVPGEYAIATFDSKGRAIAGRNLLPADIPNLDGSQIITDISVNTTGNAATADALKTARTINGVAFDGSANITVNAVDATARIALAEKGAANGVATLDSNGYVPASQLPSFVDDVIEVANQVALPATGESSKIYVTTDLSQIFRWTGSQYINISASAGTSDAANKLATARSISITGDAAFTVSFDGSQDVSAALTLADTGVAAGEHIVATYDSKGRAVSSRALVAGDIPALDSTTVSSAATVALSSEEW